MARDRIRPNGLAFSCDERTLYVSDTGATHVPGTPAAIHAYHIGSNGVTLAYDRMVAVCSAGFFDGFRVDCAIISGHRALMRCVAMHLTAH
ncbi:MAG: hypothetical protein ACRCUX_08775 [Beijerinckiaceae bacterium]